MYRIGELAKMAEVTPELSADFRDSGARVQPYRRIQ